MHFHFAGSLEVSAFAPTDLAYQLWSNAGNGAWETIKATWTADPRFTYDIYVAAGDPYLEAVFLNVSSGDLLNVDFPNSTNTTWQIIAKHKDAPNVGSEFAMITATPPSVDDQYECGGFASCTKITYTPTGVVIAGVPVRNVTAEDEGDVYCDSVCPYNEILVEDCNSSTFPVFQLSSSGFNSSQTVYEDLAGNLFTGYLVHVPGGTVYYVDAGVASISSCP